LMPFNPCLRLFLFFSFLLPSCVLRLTSDYCQYRAVPYRTYRTVHGPYACWAPSWAPCPLWLSVAPFQGSLPYSVAVPENPPGVACITSGSANLPFGPPATHNIDGGLFYVSALLLPEPFPLPLSLARSPRSPRSLHHSSDRDRCPAPMSPRSLLGYIELHFTFRDGGLRIEGSGTR
jgi:hypothetical protein